MKTAIVFYVAMNFYCGNGLGLGMGLGLGFKVGNGDCQVDRLGFGTVAVASNDARPQQEQHDALAPMAPPASLHAPPQAWQ